MLQLTV